MNVLTAFGFFAMTAMLVFYALEERRPGYILVFAVACVLGSVYGSCKAHGHSESSKAFGRS